jgi:hypothetical protein
VLLAVALAAFAVYTLAVFAWSAFQSRRWRRRLVERLRSEWGGPRTQRGSADGTGFYHAAYGGLLRGSLDSTTWADLILDAVFGFVDRTGSVLGREVLYSRLRETRGSQEELLDFDRLAERFERDDRGRLAVQTSLAGITERSATTAWQLALETPQAMPVWMQWLLPGFALTVATILVAIVVKPVLISAAVPVIAGALILRTRIAWRISPWVAPFLSVGQILQAARRVVAVEPPTEPTTVVVREHLPKLARLGGIARWLGRDPSRSDLAALGAEYLNWFFCADGIALLLASGVVARYQRELREVAEALGRLDAAIAVASVRAGSRWARPEFVDSSAPACLVGITHPLVNDCVPNTVTLGPVDGVILTGANMTGKSTFIRAIGTNVILAQSLCTAFAQSYQAPWMGVRSCINPSDSLEEGKSLYQMEAETVVSILAQAAEGGVTLCLFDELFRGTNSVDRVGASAAVYASLVNAGQPQIQPSRLFSRSFVVAATHDLELVRFVGPGFAAFHFGDRVALNRLEFDYRLRPGVAPSRNAIALLQLLGAPKAVVDDAQARADRIEAAASRSPTATPPGL